MKFKKLDYKGLLFILIMYLFVLQNVLQHILYYFKYLDEIFSLVSIPLFLISLIKNKCKLKLDRDYAKLITSLLILIIIGFAGNMIYKYQPIKYVLSDVLLVIKFFLAYYVSKKIFDEKIINENKKLISVNIKLIISLLFILTILNYSLKIWPFAYRFGIMSNKLFFDHPTILASICIFLMAGLFIINDKRKNNYVFLIICFGILLTTLRMKAIAAAIIIIITVCYILTKKCKLNIFKLAVLAIIGIIIAFDQINYYYIEVEDSARSELTKKSIEIAKDYFPIGTGFGTYGSYMSAQNYSKVYYLYNLQGIHGLQPDKASFVSDTFWPMILGQFGIIGLFCYIIAISIIYKRIQNEFNINCIIFYLSQIICLVYLIISSTS